MNTLPAWYDGKADWSRVEWPYTLSDDGAAKLVLFEDGRVEIQWYDQESDSMVTKETFASLPEFAADSLSRGENMGFFSDMVEPEEMDGTLQQLWIVTYPERLRELASLANMT